MNLASTITHRLQTGMKPPFRAAIRHSSAPLSPQTPSHPLTPRLRSTSRANSTRPPQKQFPSSDKGDYDGAEALYRRALEGGEKALGAEHPSTLESVNNLGILLGEKGDYHGAKEFFLRALDGYEKALGADHPDTLMSVNNLGILLSEKGDYDGAEALYRRALEGYEKALGAEHLETIASAYSLASVINRGNRRPEAISLLRLFASFSATSRDAVAYNLACYECLEGNLEEAKRLISEHLKLHPEKKEQALADEDFAAIHDWMSELEV